VDEIELTQAAVFSLQQAAQRIRTLADQARAQALNEQLRALADVIDGHARDLAAPRETAP
jgi:hypothetical protein